MQLWELLLLALGVSMDAFAVSICKGLSMKRATLKEGAICGAWFGGFQALMPIFGYYLASLFAEAIQVFDHWVAFILLAIIGANMLKEAFSCKCCENEEVSADLSFKTMFVMAIATSIDALAVGITLKMELDPSISIYVAVALIGIITFIMCTIGVKIGNLFGSRYEKGAQIAGGGILIALGLKILLEDLGVFDWVQGLLAGGGGV